MTQSTTIYTNYLSDQLRENTRRDELVNAGRLSRNEAEQQAEEWEQVRLQSTLQAWLVRSP